MRSVLLAGAAALAVVMATFACSSSAPVTPAEEDAGTVIPKDDPPADDEPDPTPQPDPVDAGPIDDGGDEDGSGGSTDGDAGVSCLPDSIRESETNDTEATADPLAWKTGSFCGRLAGDDVDFMTFTIPSSQNGFQFSMSRSPNNNAYKIECSVDGQSFAFNGNYPYVIGKPYFCKISLTGPQAADYRVNLTVTPN